MRRIQLLGADELPGDGPVYIASFFQNEGKAAKNNAFQLL